MAFTKMGLPRLVLTLRRLNSSVTSVIHFSFSDPYGNSNSSAPVGAEATFSFCGMLFFPQPAGKSCVAIRTKRNAFSARGARERNCAHRIFLLPANLRQTWKIKPLGPRLRSSGISQMRDSTKLPETTGIVAGIGNPHCYSCVTSQSINCPF